MQNVFLILMGAAIGSHVLIISKLLIDYRHIISARILSLQIVGAACYMLQPYVTDATNFLLLLQLGTMVTPALFWMFASTLLAAEPRLHLGHYAGLCACLVVGLISCTGVLPSSPGTFMHALGLACTSSMVILGLFDIFRNWSSDLVECRRLLRVGLAVSSGIFLLSIVVSESIYGYGQFPQALNNVNIAIITFLSLGLAYVVLISKSNLLSETIETLEPEPVLKEKVEPSLGDSQWLKSLTYAMEVEYCYRQVDMTIRKLSEYLNIPEHHLRRMINQHLGYRNFNDYLNRYRINDAAERLADPQLVKTPILTIAIESGYASLTTFNKAFKALKEMTPSEFRRSNELIGGQELTDL
jgi:AraC-like DNA-binding protein